MEIAERLEETGVARLPEILGHVMAHEIGHLPVTASVAEHLQPSNWTNLFPASTSGTSKLCRPPGRKRGSRRSFKLGR
jgi:hypothetical protein